VVRQGILTNIRCAPRVAVSASAAIKRFYAPQVSSTNSASVHPMGSKRLSPQELLNKRHPKSENEALASIIDGELDYDTDMGAAAVNNVEAEKRAEIAAKAAKIAKETKDDEFSQRNYP
ncbi:hypothetical protein IWW52_005367, partial [Coemansia sp. RSA 2704]